ESENLKRLQGNLKNDENAKVREMAYQKELLDDGLKVVDNLKAAIETKQASLKQLTEELKTNKIDLKNIHNEKKRLNDEKKTFNGELRGAKTELTNAENQNREVRRKYQAQNNKVETLRQNAQMLNQRSERLSTNAKHIKERLDNKTEQVRENTTATEAVRGTLNAQRLRYENAQRAMKTSKNDLVTLKTNIKNVDEEIVRNEKKFNELKEELNRMHENYDQNEDVKAANYKRIERIEKNLTGLKQHHYELQKDHTTKIHNIAESKQAVGVAVVNPNTVNNTNKIANKNTQRLN
ncbi:unnamed protein product, partial [Rotaria sp. Silwood1]